MSTIKVDTLQTRAGSTAAVTGAGFVATDKIRGNTAANSVTVVGEGGTVTTNLQLGLTKVWIVVGLDDTTIDDSFNVASVTDTATGRLTVTITNDMASANYSGGAMAQAQSSNNNCTHYFSNEAAGTVVLEIVENGSKFDAASTQAHILGDLA